MADSKAKKLNVEQADVDQVQTYERVVETPNGNQKRIIATDLDEFNEAVKAVSQEEVAPSPDIDNPKDGNKRMSDM